LKDFLKRGRGNQLEFHVFDRLVPDRRAAIVDRGFFLSLDANGCDEILGHLACLA
jgi:hypothetical protein